MRHDQTDKRRYSLFAKSLKSCVEPSLRPVFKAQGTTAARIISEWPGIVGAELSKHCSPLKINFPKQKNAEGTLIIACSGAHALELQHMTPQILARIASYFGYQAVTRIAIEQRYIAPAAPAKKPLVRKARNIDTSCLDAVTDPELKAALSDFANELS